MIRLFDLVYCCSNSITKSSTLGTLEIDPTPWPAEKMSFHLLAVALLTSKSTFSFCFIRGISIFLKSAMVDLIPPAFGESQAF